MNKMKQAMQQGISFSVKCRVDISLKTMRSLLNFNETLLEYRLDMYLFGS